jgi:hypothetical protein
MESETTGVTLGIKHGGKTQCVTAKGKTSKPAELNLANFKVPVSCN